MLDLLEQMIRGADEDFSPMKFAVSVHNAAAGLVSISTHNRAFTTSVAADHDTPAMALLEGIGAMAALDRPAVVCGDEAAPEGLEVADPSCLLVTASTKGALDVGEAALAGRAPSGSRRACSSRSPRASPRSSGTSVPASR
jgi:hypothetical protein